MMEPLGSRIYNLRKLTTERRERFLAGRRSERQYAAQIRRIGEQVDTIVRGMAPNGVVTDLSRIMVMLNKYADLLSPWAESVVDRMIRDVSRRDAGAWEKHGKEIGKALRQEIDHAPTGQVFRQMLDEQVLKITSLPREAAERLYKLTSEALPTGTRASEIAKQIMASGEVTKSHAMMLARTGVSSTATAMTRARAEFIGSPGYIWRTTRDGAVRPSHKAMEGKFVPWNDPPTLDGYTAHAGEYANCRCGPEVVIPDA